MTLLQASRKADLPSVVTPVPYPVMWRLAQSCEDVLGQLERGRWRVQGRLVANIQPVMQLTQIHTYLSILLGYAKVSVQVWFGIQWS